MQGSSLRTPERCSVSKWSLVSSCGRLHESRSGCLVGSTVYRSAPRKEVWMTMICSKERRSQRLGEDVEMNVSRTASSHNAHTPTRGLLPCFNGSSSFTCQAYRDKQTLKPLFVRLAMAQLSSREMQASWNAWPSLCPKRGTETWCCTQDLRLEQTPRIATAELSYMVAPSRMYSCTML